MLSIYDSRSIEAYSISIRRLGTQNIYINRFKTKIIKRGLYSTLVSAKDIKTSSQMQSQIVKDKKSNIIRICCGTTMSEKCGKSWYFSPSFLQLVSQLIKDRMLPGRTVGCSSIPLLSASSVSFCAPSIVIDWNENLCSMLFRY